MPDEMNARPALDSPILDVNAVPGGFPGGGRPAPGRTALVLAPKPPRSPAGPLRYPARLLVVALGLGGLGQALLYGQSPGVGVPAFLVLCIAALTALGRCEGRRLRARVAFTIVPALCFFAVCTAVRDETALTWLDGAAVRLLGVILVCYWGDGDLTTIGIAALLALPACAAGHALADPLPAVRSVALRGGNAGVTRRRAVATTAGLLLTVPLLAVFVPLLITADSVFQHEAAGVIAWLFPPDWADRLGRVGFALFVAWAAAGLLVCALTRRGSAPDTRFEKGIKHPLGYVEGMIPLAAIAALFASFIGVQFAALFGGAAWVRSVPGLTAAEYARQGFAELVIVAVLTLLVATVWNRLLDCASPVQRRGFHGVVTVLTLLTLVMLTSAHQRMAAYETAFGDTPARLYADVLIAWLAVTLSAFVWTLWARRQDRFAFAGLVAALACVAWLNVLDPDATAARVDVARAANGTQALDNDSLSQLSADAVPVLADAFDRYPRLRPQLIGTLRARLHAPADTADGGWRWPSWNASRERANDLLEARRGMIDAAH